MAKGITRYFVDCEPTSIVDARYCLDRAADRFEDFLKGEGKDSDLSRGFDDLDVAGLRSTAMWIPPDTRMVGVDIYELFSIATSGNCRPAPGQSDSTVYEKFKHCVDSFVKEHKIRIQQEDGGDSQAHPTS